MTLKQFLISGKFFQYRDFHSSIPKSAGHSKWANIKHIKSSKDSQKAFLFHKLSRQIRLAIMDGGANPELNSQLKNIVDLAVRNNMPLATIKNIIKSSQQDNDNRKEYTVEFRYKQSVFGICILFANNIPKVKSEISPIFKKFGAQYTDTSHLFNEFGLIEAKLLIPEEKLEKQVMEDAINIGAEDVDIVDKNSGDVHFTCSPLDLNSVRRSLQMKGYLIENSERVFSAKNVINISSDELELYNKFSEKVRNVSDVETIFDNVDRNDIV